MDQAELERRWCARLLKEWIAINKNHSLGLKPPGIGLLSSGKKLGDWDPNTRIIRIHKDLILTHPFATSTEILRHESAHMYASEIFKDTSSKPHGEVFQKACEIVGVHPDFRGRSGILPKFLRTESGEDTKISSLQRKVEKLMALAESSQENEAQAAMDKANALIAKYNLDLISNSDPEQEYDCIQFKIGSATRIEKWMKTILHIVRSFYFVQTILLTQYDQHTDKEYKAVEFLGTTENLKVAEHVFNFLNERLPVFWKKYRNETGALTKERNSYYMGVLNGFIEKLSASDQARNAELLSQHKVSTTSALVLAQDTSLKDFYQNRYPTAKKTRGRRSRVYAQAFGDGHQEGKRLTIHRTVQNSSGNQGKLLT